MARPLEKTHRVDVETLRVMQTAYGSPECLSQALGMHIMDIRRMLRGEGLRPADHARVMERWAVVDPGAFREIVSALYEQTRDDRATVATLGFVEVDELRHFFNALFPHLRV